MFRDPRLEAFIGRREFAGYLISLFLSLAATGAFLSFASELSGLLEDLLFEQGELIAVKNSAVLILIYAFLRFLFSAGSEYLSSRNAVAIQMRITDELLAYLKGSNVLKTGRGDAAGLPGLLGEGLDRLYSFFAEYIPRLMTAAAVPLLFLIAAFPMDWISGLVLLFTAPLIPLFIVLVNHKVRQMNTEQWQVLQRLSSYFSHSLKAMLIIRVFGIGEERRDALTSVNRAFGEKSFDILKVAFLSAFVLEFMATLGTALIAVEVGIRLLHGGLDFGVALFLLILAPEFYIPLRQSGAKFHAAAEASAAAEQISNLLRRGPGEEDQGKIKLKGRVERIMGRDISLAFGGRYVFNGVGFLVQWGEILLVRGPSGSGKSSLAMMLMKYLPYSRGNVTVNDLDLQDIDREHWLRRCSYIPQHVHLFRGSVRYNMSFSDNPQNDTRIWEILERLGLGERIAAHPEGLGMEIGDGGGGLSGGERQRIAVGRALLDPPDILILDEISAQVDRRAEEEMFRILDDVKKRSVVILLSHSPNAADYADRILDLKEYPIEGGGNSGNKEQEQQD